MPNKRSDLPPGNATLIVECNVPSQARGQNPQTVAEAYQQHAQKLHAIAKIAAAHGVEANCGHPRQGMELRVDSETVPAIENALRNPLIVTDRDHNPVYDTRGFVRTKPDNATIALEVKRAEVSFSDAVNASGLTGELNSVTAMRSLPVTMTTPRGQAR